MIRVLDHQNKKIIGFMGQREFVRATVVRNLQDLSESLELERFMPRNGTDNKTFLISGRRRVVVPDERPGKFREFIIDNYKKIKSRGTLSVFCKPSFLDLKKAKVITPRTYNGQTCRTMTMELTDETEWEVGQIDTFNIRTITFDEHTDPYTALKQVASAFDMELQFRIETEGNIIRRYVDMLQRVGGKTPVRIEYRKNLADIERNEVADIVTALYCVGPEKEDGTFETAIVEDEEARQRWGIGPEKKHLIEIYKPESTNTDMTKAQLESYGKTELKKRIDASVEYTITAHSIDGKELFLGDQAFVKDLDFQPELFLEARVIEVKRSLLEDKVKELTVGQIVEFSRTDIMSQLDALKDNMFKIIRSPEPPEGNRNVLWIKTGGLYPVPYTWNGQEWLKQAPTIASEVGAVTPGELAEQAQRTKEEAIEYANTIGDALTEDISALDQKVATFEGYIDGSFSDGIIDRVESENIGSYAQDINSRKVALDAQYNSIFNHELLPLAQKTQLSDTKNIFNQKNQALLTAIQNAIADNKATEAEKTAVDNAFVEYRTALQNLNGSIQMAINSITAQSAEKAKDDAITYTQEELTNYVDYNTYDEKIVELQKQLDGAIENWFIDVDPTLTNAPAVDWATKEDKDRHLGDIAYNRTSGHAFRFMVVNGVYSWELIQDSDIAKALEMASDAQDTADGKRRVFLTTPTAPYDRGDLWRNANLELLVCVNPKVAGQAYSSSDWALATKYTDDTKAIEADGKAENAQGTADQAIEDAKNAQETADNKVDNYVYTQKVNELNNAIADKIGADYVDGKIIDLAHKDDVYTRVEIDDNFKNFVNVTTYQTDQEGVVQQFSDLSSRLTNTETGLTSKVEKTLFDNFKTEAEGKYQSYDSQFQQTAEELSFVVREEDFTGEAIIGKMNLTSDAFKVQAKNLDLTGLVKITSLNSPGEVIIDAGNITAGTLTLGGPNGAKMIMLNTSGESVATFDSESEIMGFDKLNVGDLNSPSVVRFSDKDLKFYVSDRVISGYNVAPDDNNTGDGWASPLRTVSEAIRRIPRYYAGNAYIYLAYNAVISEKIVIEGYSGPGNIYILGSSADYKATIAGSIYINRSDIHVSCQYLKIFADKSIGATSAPFIVDMSKFCSISYCEIQGHSTAGYGVQAKYRSGLQVIGVSFQDVDHGVVATATAQVYNYNTSGQVRNSGLLADGGIIHLNTNASGNVPRGSSTWFGQGNTDVPNGGLIVGTKVGNDGGAVVTPPTQTNDVTERWSSTGGESWRPNSGNWYVQQPAQGYWRGFGVYKGFWYFPASMSTKVTGKSIKMIRVYIERTSGGTYASTPVYIRTHNYTSRPSGEPLVSNLWYKTDLEVGQKRWVTLSDDFCRAFENGAKGIAVYYNSQNERNYAKFSSSAIIEITYQ
jgi:phage minor structural protein